MLPSSIGANIFGHTAYLLTRLKYCPRPKAPSCSTTMKPVAALLYLCASGLAANVFQRATDVCLWRLDGDDCICMNSQNGALLKDQTTTCCTAMGLKTKDLVSGVLGRVDSGCLSRPDSDFSHRRSAMWRIITDR